MLRDALRNRVVLGAILKALDENMKSLRNYIYIYKTKIEEINVGFARIGL